MLFAFTSFKSGGPDSGASSISSFSMVGQVYRGYGQHKTTPAMTKKEFWPLQLAGYPDKATQKQFIKDLRMIDWEEVKKDIVDVMLNSQPWWPADYGSYGGLFTRLSWHTCGSYRSSDGRGGCDGGGQR
jgi:catalase (peroxidase I)